MLSKKEGYIIKISTRNEDDSQDTHTFPLFDGFNIQEIDEVSQGAQLEDILIQLGTQKTFTELQEQKDKQSDYLLISNIIDTFFEYISTSNRANEIKYVHFTNYGTEQGMTDQVFQWLEKLEFKNTQTLQVICHYLSDAQYIKLYEIITQKMRSLESLCMHCAYRGQGLRKKKLKKEKHKLETISFMLITSLEQLDMLRLFPTLQTLLISYSFGVEAKIEQLIKQINLYSPALSILSLDVGAIYPFKSGCLKGIEKLKQLGGLLLTVKRRLSIKDLDINSMKKLVLLELKCFDPKSYVSEIKSDRTITILVIQNLVTSQQNEKPLFISNLQHLENFTQVFTCKQKSAIETLRSDLREIAKIAHQLVDLHLDFSDCNYYSDNYIGGDIIALIGDIFEKCTIKTKITLTISNCLIRMNELLDLALQLQKIQSIEQFTIDNINLIDKLKDANQVFDDNYFLTLFYGIFQSLPQYHSVIVPLLIGHTIPKNLLIENPYRQLFTSQSRFTITDKTDQENDDNFYSEYLKKILPEDAKYIEIDADISFDEIIQIKNNFEFLNQLTCTLLQNSKIDLSQQALKKRKPILLKIKVYQFCLDYERLQDIFLIEHDVIEIYLSLQMLQDNSHLIRLLSKLKEVNQRVLIWINENSESDFEFINHYSNKINAEKSKICAFDQLIKLQLSVNPLMVYSDLYLD